MVSAFEVAEAHQARVAAISSKAASRALAAWALMDFGNLDASWLNVGPAVTSLTVAAQASVASTSNAYLGSASAGYGNTVSADQVNPYAFTGIDGSGRDVSGLLAGSVTATKQAVGAGLGEAQSLLSGATYLAAMLKTAVHDISRSSDLTGMTGHSYTAYVRVVQAGACSRCAILAGTASAKKAFLRHPACKCSTYPVEKLDGPPKGFHDSPSAYFDSLSKAEQDKVFSKAGAEAVRAGADPVTVVSARRGASGISYGRGIGRSTTANSGRRMTRTVIGRNPDGSPVMGYVTSEGNTIRGQFGKANDALRVERQRLANARYRSLKRTRLMPESIIPLTDDVELRRVLLRDAGYLEVPVTGAEFNSPLGGGYAARRLAIQQEDRRIADDFYRKHGIQLGG